ncbi:MAG: lipoyl(octanoyl) transferase LipB [Deltaproteobacteria bacterium]|nr:lipoyl(octanoyl) transferase LipB [Deltaproteobacteria bacterium]
MAPVPLSVRDLGLLDYARALEVQREVVAARRRGEIEDTLLFVEHPPVFTLGRRRSARYNVVAPGDTPVIEVSRGGDVTWHGPGQLVGYPILALAPAERDLHEVLRRLEAALIDVLQRCGLPAARRPGFTGVWCGARKLVSVGIAVEGWVTFHGFALNVDPDLSWFARINPCGLDASVMGSMRSEGVVPPEPAALRLLAARAIAAAFDRTLSPDTTTPGP